MICCYTDCDLLGVQLMLVELVQRLVGIAAPLHDDEGAAAGAHHVDGHHAPDGAEQV